MGRKSTRPIVDGKKQCVKCHLWHDAELGYAKYGRSSNARRTVCHECVKLHCKAWKAAKKAKEAHEPIFFDDYEGEPHLKVTALWKGIKNYPVVCLINVNRVNI